MLRVLRRYFSPAPASTRLSAEETARQYPWFRWRIMESTFIGYGTFYLVRNNLSPVAKEIEGALQYNHSTIGDILAITAISYGVSKFMMGSVSDRCDARKFMAAGLLLTACCNFAFGSVANYYVHLALWSLNGFAQGMGWPPCGRSIGPWFSENERGLKFSIWNTSHNVGGGIAGYLASWAVAEYGGWQYAFYVPGALAAMGAAYLLLRLRDTPQSVGLPPVEEYRNDYPSGDSDPESRERTLTARELFFDKVLTNKYVWLLAFANFFAYIARYSMLDWGPTYLREVKDATLQQGGLAVLVNEFGGIPSTIFLGWVSDRLGGRRGMVAALCTIPIFACFAVLVYTPKGYLWLDFTMLALIGLFVYPVINLIVIAALDVVSKKAIGTAAGFIGLFGYIARTVQAKGFGWAAHHYTPLYGEEVAWNIILYTILGCAEITGVLLALLWRLTPRA
ncbi:MAG: MFS transporter [Planctomycetales bacterium]|nr:MFS transporter [Planctomycetales bacterium]